MAQAPQVLPTAGLLPMTNLQEGASHLEAGRTRPWLWARSITAGLPLFRRGGGRACGSPEQAPRRAKNQLQIALRPWSHAACPCCWGGWFWREQRLRQLEGGREDKV